MSEATAQVSGRAPRERDLYRKLLELGGQRELEPFIAHGFSTDEVGGIREVTSRGQPRGDSKRGVGVFFSFGASDGRANPIDFVYCTGIGGKGVVPARPRDSFGVGWARTEFSGNFVPFLRERVGLGLDREDAIEMYYKASLTGWLEATLDLQVLETGLQKKLDASSGRLEDIGTAVVPGVCLYARF